MDEHSRASKLFITGSWVFGIVLMICILLISYLVLFPKTKFEFADGPYVIVNKDSTVVAGEFLYIESPGFCNYGTSTVIVRNLTNTFGSLELPSLAFKAPSEPFCFENVGATNSVVTSGALSEKLVTPVLIPEEVPAGEWVIEFLTIYKANPLREITISKTTPVFIVTPSENMHSPELANTSK